MAEIIEFSKFESERVLPPIRALNPTQADYLDALRSRHWDCLVTRETRAVPSPHFLHPRLDLDR